MNTSFNIQRARAETRAREEIVHFTNAVYKHRYTIPDPRPIILWRRWGRF